MAEEKPKENEPKKKLAPPRFVERLRGRRGCGGCR